MVLDVRAEMISTLGPVISGDIRDDHIQGQGLIYTTGNLVISGLITPSKGDSVELAYVKAGGGKASRFPRSLFKVVKAFSNPLKNQTEVQIADELAYHKGQGGGNLNTTLTRWLTGSTQTTNPVLNLKDAASVICDRVGITVGSLGNWSLSKQITSLECRDYIETLSDILASAGHFGYMDAQNKLQVVSYAELNTTGPQLGFEDIIDINPNAGGLDFSEQPVGTGDAQQIEDDSDPGVIYLPGVHIGGGSYGSFSTDWATSSVTTSGSLSIILKDGTSVAQPYTETVSTSEQTAEPDRRTLSRETVVTGSLVKYNAQAVQDYLNANKSGVAGGTTITTRKKEVFTYQEIQPDPLSEAEREQRQNEIDAAIAAGADEVTTITLLPNLPTFKIQTHTIEETASYIEALGRSGIQDYSKFSEGLPTGEGIKYREVIQYAYSPGLVKEKHTKYIAFGLSQSGQQAIASAASKVTPTSYTPFIDLFFSLIIEDHWVVTRQVPSADDQQPVPDYLAPYESSDVVIQGTSQIQIGSTSPDRSNNTSFSVPFLPDDIINDDGSVTDGESLAAATQFAEEQNLLLLGHRIGMQITTALGKLPSLPLQTFHVANSDVTATYRTNGMAWAFDNNSCMVSCDSLYWGLAGGDISGARWTPVAPGVTTLSSAPTTVDNGAQDPVNSNTYSGPLDVSNQTAINAIIASLPDTETETFKIEVTPSGISVPYAVKREGPFSLRIGCDVLRVPLGINRNMGSVDCVIQSILKAEQEVSIEAVAEFDSTDYRIVGETISGGFSFGGNVS